MPGERNSLGQESITVSTASTSRVQSRRLRWLSIIVVIIVVMLGLLSFYAPRYIARYLLASELNEFGIDYEGVESLNINLWTRELWLGPVRFGLGRRTTGNSVSWVSPYALILY